MSELERQLRENPDDDEAWSVFADLLLERGDPRGENRDPTDAERAAWRGGIPARAATGWRCGHVVEITLPVHTKTTHTLRTILAMPEARFVSSLRLIADRGWRDEDYHVVPAVDLDRDPLDAIFNAIGPQIRKLALAYVRFEAYRLAWFPPLVELDLRYAELGDDGAMALAKSPAMRTVKRLHLQRNGITSAGARWLAESPNLRALELLDLRYNDIGDVRFDHVRVLRVYDSDTTIRVKRFVAPDAPPVHVDARELSFHTYENIVTLDRHLEPITCTLDAREALAADVLRFAIRGADGLAKLDELPLYVAPLDTTSRGGQRYIFHCAQLAEALTTALRDALPDAMRAGFAHVNPVFRCNRFEPGDAPFAPHLDTPYYDADRKHVSRYTLLIYLTGGEGRLQIGDIAVDAIAPMTALIFHQRYEHGAAPYADGRKVFLRTELIYEDATVEHDPQIAALFARACYLTGEQLHHDAAAAYITVAAAHWQGLRERPASGPFVRKSFRGVEWLANGYDFWFAKSTPLVECATLTLLDYLNCTLDGQPFRAACTTEVVGDVDPETFLVRTSGRACATLDKAALFPPSELATNCCPTHRHSHFDASVSDDVIDLYDAAQRFARTRIGPAPICMLGQDVYLDPSRFVIEGNRIHVLSAQRLAPVNFAACWNSNSSPPNYLDVDVALGVVQPLVPPILWEATETTHHLMFDFFRNSWMVSHEQLVVPVPKIRIVDPETVDESDEPWMAAAANASPVVNPYPSSKQIPWWTSYHGHTLVNAELYRNRKPR